MRRKALTFVVINCRMRLNDMRRFAGQWLTKRPGRQSPGSFLHRFRFLNSQPGIGLLDLHGAAEFLEVLADEPEILTRLRAEVTRDGFSIGVR